MTETPAEPSAFVTLAQFKDFARIKSDDRDEELQEILDAAIEHVAGKVNASLTGDTLRIKVRPRGRTLLLPYTELRSVGAITRPDGSVVPAETADVDLEAGIVTVPTAAAGTWHVEVEPKAGTASLRQAVKIIAKHLRGANLGTGDGPRSEVDAQQLSGFATPHRAKELLEPYVAAGGFA